MLSEDTSGINRQHSLCRCWGLRWTQSTQCSFPITQATPTGRARSSPLTNCMCCTRGSSLTTSTTMTTC
ncbi:hypothetical protein JZ751_014021 [Albula glossodonta]|uniref:Uncharacterized protein n=1 Tax=Albula glossodonta TaxID=121402 RepID=A0A8T2N8U7_9TELE|nr:hypothetical protein JZ751_014021 [Albula glossodonta]